MKEKMMKREFKSDYIRPHAWEEVYKWHLGQVPDDDPSKKSAIFIVHGMGKQAWAETAAALRVGIEDALESLLPKKEAVEELPAPFVQEGFWANYDNLEESIPEEWKKLEDTKQDFFSNVWKLRSISGFKTFRWLIVQLLRLVFDPSVVRKESPLAWFLYFLLMFVAPPIFIVIIIFMPRVISEILNDVRLYCSPRGMVERAIVQRIDYRVGEAFIKLIGLDWDFRKLKAGQYAVDNKPIEFDHVFWVAHSLGTVVSYNVLSDLFARADELALNGDAEQKIGVKRFWNSLPRFITLGSPLDKIAVLFTSQVLRPWPERMFKPEKEENKEKNKSLGHFRPNWWINYYHFLDPVSGALSNELICPKTQMPNNYHLDKFFYIPGLAHLAYWKNNSVLCYILSRFYTSERVKYTRNKPYPPFILNWFALIAYLVWLGIIAGIVIGIIALFGWI